MLRALIDVLFIVLSFTVFTSAAWLVVGCAVMVSFWDDSYLSPFEWPSAVFYPVVGLTFIGWLGVLILRGRE